MVDAINNSISKGVFPDNANIATVGTRYRGDIGFLLDFHRDVDQLRIDIEVTSLNYVFFQYHIDVVAITSAM